MEDISETTPILSPTVSAENEEKKEVIVFARQQRAPICTLPIEIAVVLYFLSMSAGMPILSQYVYERTATEFNATAEINVTCSENDTDLDKTIQRNASMKMFWLNLSMMGPSIVATLFYSSYSDSIGRKLPLCLPIFGLAVHYISMFLVTHFSADIRWLYIPFLFEGCMGGSVTFIAAAFSHLSDRTTTEQRSFRIIVMDFCMGFTSALMNLLSGYIIEGLTYSYTFLLLFAISVLCLIYSLVFISETIKRESEAKHKIWKNIKRCFQVFFSEHHRRRKKLLTCLMLVLLCAPVVSRADIITLYFRTRPLCFSRIKIGLFNFGWLISSYAGGITLTALCRDRIGDTGLILVGCLSISLSTLLNAFTTRIVEVVLVVLLSSFVVLPVSMTRSFASKLVDRSDYGSIFAGIGCLQSISFLLFTLAFDGLFAATAGSFKGSVFILQSFMGIVSLFLAVLLIIWSKKAGRLINNP
ncbi:DgyrCDS6093 [Dimorphilus gyrociliatus]|uniref:DgyrCDS6093 n=1 Tax=Dimorphilus gyrociliatus TaxID=2664684 RepID=A0A7I8VPT8_9ANNE|nr:DgyrCDS6093 [Dimorphilus gyrociliatus]